MADEAAIDEIEGEDLGEGEGEVVDEVRAAPALGLALFYSGNKWKHCVVVPLARRAHAACC